MISSNQNDGTDLFKPERWDRDNHVAHPNMFASLPFGHGPRILVSNLTDHSIRIKHLVFLLHAGRRVAQLELHIALSHLIRNFEIEYLDNSPMGYIY